MAVEAGELRGRLVHRERVGVAVHVDAAALDVLRIEPGAVVEDDDALEDALRHIGARKRCAALVGDEHDVAVPDAACGGVIGMDPERLAVLDVGEVVAHRAVELAVHAVAALAGHEGERSGLGRVVDAFGRLEIGRMSLAVVVAVARDLGREELDEAAFGRERIGLGILAEGFEGHVVAVLLGNVEHDVALLPEFVKVGHVDLAGLAHLLRAFVEAAYPAHFVKPFGVLGLDAEALGELGEDPVVRVGFKARLDCLLHGDEAVVRVGADARDVVVLEGCAGREHDVGMARRRAPDGVGDDDRFGLLPGALELHRVGLMGKGIAARPHDELDFRIGHLAAVEVDRLARMEEAFRKAGDRNRRRTLPVLVEGKGGLHLGGHAGEERPVGHRSAAARILVVRADAAARKADLAENAREREGHPVRLLAVLDALDAPADHEHRAVLLQVVREPADAFGGDARLFRGPFRRLLHAVLLAHDVGAKLLPAAAALLKEGMVGLAGDFELVHHAEHHGAVRARTRSDPFGAEILGRVGRDRVDRDRGDALVAQGADVARGVVNRRVPVDVVGHERVAPPEDHAFAVCDDDVPGRGARVARADDVGQDLADGGRRIGVFALDEAAAEVEEALLQIDGRIDAARAHPAVGAAEDGARTVVLVDALHFARHEVKGLIPGDGHELLVAAAPAALRAVLEPAFSNHRLADAGRRIRKMAEAVEVGARRIVEFKRAQMRHLAALNVRINDAPARGVDDLAFVERGAAQIKRLRELRIGRGHRIRLPDRGAFAAGRVVLLQQVGRRFDTGGMSGNGGGKPGRGSGAEELAAGNVSHLELLLCENALRVREGMSMIQE